MTATSWQLELKTCFAFPFDIIRRAISQLTFCRFSRNSIKWPVSKPEILSPCLQIGSRARRLATAQLSGRTGCTALPLGGWLHNVRLASYGARLPLVRLHRAELPPLPQVSYMPLAFFEVLHPICIHSGDTATCLHNAPHEDSALGRSLPGTLLSLDAQCRRDRGTYACFKDERVCAQLFCFDAQTGYCVAYRPAAEGSSCGNGYVSMRKERLNFCLPMGST